jgi:hypothetical protein
MLEMRLYAPAKKESLVKEADGTGRDWRQWNKSKQNTTKK